jgi:hypothetical protein
VISQQQQQQQQQKKKKKLYTQLSFSFFFPTAS